MKNMFKHGKLNLLAVTVAGLFSAQAMSATDSQALAAAIAQQEKQLMALKSQLEALAKQQKNNNYKKILRLKALFSRKKMMLIN